MASEDLFWICNELVIIQGLKSWTQYDTFFVALT